MRERGKERRMRSNPIGCSTWAVLVVLATAPHGGAAAPDAVRTAAGHDTPLRLRLVDASLDDLCRVLTARTGVEHRCADSGTGDLLSLVIGQMTAGQLR